MQIDLGRFGEKNFEHNYRSIMSNIWSRWSCSKYLNVYLHVYTYILSTVNGIRHALNVKFESQKFLLLHNSLHFPMGTFKNRWRSLYGNVLLKKFCVSDPLLLLSRGKSFFFKSRVAETFGVSSEKTRSSISSKTHLQSKQVLKKLLIRRTVNRDVLCFLKLFVVSHFENLTTVSPWILLNLKSYY